jgi:hypothetical protein
VYGRNVWRVWHSGKLLREGKDDGGNDGDDDKAESELVQRFTETRNTIESMRATVYAHITKRDHGTMVG